MKIQEAVMLLELYSSENGTTIRSTSDLSPLEEWLINKILSERELYQNTMSEMRGELKQQYNQAVKDIAEKAKAKARIKYEAKNNNECDVIQYYVDQDSILKLLK